MRTTTRESSFECRNVEQGLSTLEKKNLEITRKKIRDTSFQIDANGGRERERDKRSAFDCRC